MRKLLKLTPLLMALFLFNENVMAKDVQPDGTLIYLVVSKDGKRVAGRIAGVKYPDQAAPKDISKYLNSKHELNTQMNIFDKEGVLAKPETGNTRTLEGNITIQLRFTAKEVYATITLKKLTLTYACSYIYAEKWNVTKWTVSDKEIERIRKIITK